MVEPAQHIVELLRVVGKALADLEPMRQARKLAVGLFCNGRPVDEANACPARAEELLCYSLFSNLIKNALEASPQGATVTLDCVRDKDGWRVDIHNQGETPEAISMASDMPPRLKKRCGGGNSGASTSVLPASSAM